MSRYHNFADMPILAFADTDNTLLENSNDTTRLASGKPLASALICLVVITQVSYSFYNIKTLLTIFQKSCKKISTEQVKRI